MANNIFEILGMSSATSTIKHKPAMFENPFSFDGRIRRTEYGISFILYLVIYLELINFIIHPDQDDNNPVAFILIAIPALWFLWAQGAKRCHDKGKPGWYHIVPFFFFSMLFSDSDKGENEYGLNPKEHEQPQEDSSSR